MEQIEEREKEESRLSVYGAHHLRAWNVSASSIAFSRHVEVTDQSLNRTAPLAEIIRYELFHRLGIDHPILQFEKVQCGNRGMLCELYCGKENEQG